MSLIIKMDTIKTEEHLRKSIPYIMNERKTDGLCFSNAGITPEQILDTFFLTKQMHPTHGTRQGYHFKFSFSKDETIAPEDALSFIREWAEEYLGDRYDYACSVHKDRDHMHMHLVFNSVARNGGKYRYEKGDWEKVIRPLTNRLAEKYHTGPLKEKDPALDYSPDYDRKQGTMTGKERVEQDIDQCILESRSYADFKKRLVRDYDYQLREGVSREHGVYLALTPPGRGKAIRTYRLSEGYALDQRKNINEKEKVKLDITKLEKAFAPVGDDRVKMIGKLKPEYAAIFPSFHEGQEVQEKSSVPHLASEKTVEKVLSLEKMKERYQSPEYIPVPFDMETQMVAESPNLYIANLPKEQQESKDFVRCICLDKETTSLSDDGKRLLAYLKRSDMSEITELDPNGKELRKYVKKNEEIATECLKHQRGKWNTDSPSLEKRLLQKSVSTPKNKKL